MTLTFDDVRKADQTNSTFNSNELAIDITYTPSGNPAETWSVFFYDSPVNIKPEMAELDEIDPVFYVDETVGSSAEQGDTAIIKGNNYKVLWAKPLTDLKWIKVVLKEV